MPPRTFSVTQQRCYLDFQAFSTSYGFGNGKIAVMSRPVKRLSIGNKKPSLKSAALNSIGFSFSSCWSISQLTKGRTSSFVEGSSCLFSQPPASPHILLWGPQPNPPFCQEVLKDCVECFRALYFHCRWKPLSATSEAAQSVQSSWL